MLMHSIRPLQLFMRVGVLLYVGLLLSNSVAQGTDSKKPKGDIPVTSKVPGQSHELAESRIKLITPPEKTQIPTEKYLFRLQRSERILSAQSGRSYDTEPEMRVSAFRSFADSHWLTGLEYVGAQRSSGSGNLTIESFRDELRLKGGYQDGLRSGVLWRAMLGVGGYQAKTITKFASEIGRADYSKWNLVAEAHVEAAYLFSNLELNLAFGRTIWFGPQNLEGWVVFGGIGFWGF